jgi:hypothetical protein
MELRAANKKERKEGFMWVLWIIIIILFVGFFPKTCGKINSDSLTDSKCIGVKAPFIKSENNWCYGVCIQKSIKTTNTALNLTETNPEASGLISGLMSSFSSLLKPLVIILMVMAIVKLIDSFKKRKTNMVVYKKL